MSTKLMIHSSEVSVCVGEHKYRKRWEAFKSVFERINYGTDFKKAIERLSKLGHKVVSKDERIQQVVVENHLSSNVQDFLERPVQTSEELKQSIEDFEEKLSTQEKEFKERKTQIKEQLSVQTQHHTQALQTLETLKQLQTKVKEDIIVIETSQETQESKERMNLLTHQSQQLQNQLESAATIVTQFKNEMQKELDTLSQHEQQWSKFKDTKKDIISMKQTSFGKQKEDSLIASKALGLISDNNTKYYQKVLGTTPSGLVWGIGGRIDGFRDGELIEIKNRKSHIYNPLPQYDIIQLQCYMQILDLQKATLIQSLATENNTYQTHETVVLRDDVYWKNVLLPELTVFVCAMSKFVSDPLLQDKFLQTQDNRKSFALNSMLTQVRKEMDGKTSDLDSKPKPKSKSKARKSESEPPSDSKSLPLTKKKKTPEKQTSTQVNLSIMDDFMDAVAAKSTPSQSNPSTPLPDVSSSVPQMSPVCFFTPPGEQLPVTDCSVPLEKLLPSDWALKLSHQLTQPYFKKLESFVDQDYKTFIVYPPRDKVFTAFHKCPWDQVRVVILAQDPYINPGEATGMAFSVPKGTKFPKSMKNIFEELQNDVQIPPPLTGDLTPWASQGVLLLNTVLTVRAGKSDSHAGKGWEVLTDSIIRTLSEEKPYLVFLLWGAKAQSKRGLIDQKKHTLLETSHPSPLSYTKGFKGCRHFSQTNQLLQSHGLPTINWNLNI